MFPHALIELAWIMPTNTADPGGLLTMVVVLLLPPVLMAWAMTEVACRCESTKA